VSTTGKSGIERARLPPATGASLESGVAHGSLFSVTPERAT
jgi:hypothetical protein